MLRTPVGLSWLAVWVCAAPLQAHDWPAFRGPDQNGLAGQVGIPMQWSESQNIAWTYDVPGKGWASPIVWGNRVIVATAVAEDATDKAAARPSAAAPLRLVAQRKHGRTAGEDRYLVQTESQEAAQSDDPEGGPGRRPRADRRGPRGDGGGRPGGGFGGRRAAGPPDVTYRWELHCLDLQSGEPLWVRVARHAKPRIPTHGSNTYASETPVTDGEHVYAYFGMTGLFCYDLDGNLVWEKDLGNYPMMAGWGTSSSPVLADGKLFVQLDNEEQSFLVALDAATGEELWRVDRAERSNWSTPLVWRNSQRTELVLGGEIVRAYAPADGRLLWELNVGGRSSASPAADGDLLIVGAEDRSSRGGTAGGLHAIAPGGTGDITPTGQEGRPQGSSGGVVWSSQQALGMASPLVYDHYVYVLDRRSGIVTCLDAKTGQRAYRERLAQARAFWASPWAADGHVFCLDDTGTTHVLAPGGKFHVVRANSIAGQFWSSAAVTDGTVLLRSAETLYCVRK
jgi:outer membrane protein assembly factor BamB